MQRINYFPNPNFIPTGAHSSANGKDISKYFVDHTFANTSGNDIDLPFQDYDVGVEHVCTVRVKADSSNGRKLAVWGTSCLAVASSGGTGVKTIRFVATQLARLSVPSGVTIDGLCVERADTYDPAVGGVSSLLLRRHHATRLTPRTGTVMPDDGHEPMHEPILDHHPVGRPLGGYHDHSDQARDEILGQRLCERHRRHYLDERVWRHQCKPTCQLRASRQRCRSDVNVLFRQVRQSDRHRDEYAHLHVGRVSGEQDPARRHRIFHRGYDAARLTLLGVMA
ncbi:Hypothetical protein BB215W447A_1534 [Bifidobacterium breve]|uniref:Uncharacterized protein n=1 Tax=Bifidobacterium breve TaxID=1685 RepID=A0A2K9B2Q3_BIFBR|nr:Hypothetical protein BB215W447A_1534 [Bifidobacterium breve]